MGSITLGESKFAKVEAVAGRYVGDTPPAQSYRMTTIKTWIYDDGADTPSGSASITVPLRISEPKGSKKAKYNGYTIFHRLTLGETSMPFVNAFLDAFGIDRALFHGGKFKTAEGKDTRLVALKGLPNKGALDGFEALVLTKNDEYKGNRKLIVSAMAPYVESEQSDDDEEDDFDDDEDSTTDDSDDSDEDVATSDDEDDDAF